MTISNLDNADEMLVLNLDENRELLQEFHAETVDHLQEHLGTVGKNLPGGSGGAILDDGDIALMLDPGALIPAAA